MCRESLIDGSVKGQYATIQYQYTDQCNPRGEMANVLDCDIVVTEWVRTPIVLFQSRLKRMYPLILSAMG